MDPAYTKRVIDLSFFDVFYQPSADVWVRTGCRSLTHVVITLVKPAWTHVVLLEDRKRRCSYHGLNVSRAFNDTTTSLCSMVHAVLMNVDGPMYTILSCKSITLCI